jgi:shikimate dehydrogenase
LHNAAFRAAGIDAVFVALRVEPANLASAVRGLAALEVLGASVTVPHKQSIIEHCDRLDVSAEQIGAVNCLEIDGSAIIGHNTDGYGFIDSARTGLGFEPDGSKVVLLGGGGAARSLHWALVDAGATVRVVARTPTKVGWESAEPWESLDQHLAGADLLVDCTTIGLSSERESQASPIALDALPDTAAVATLVYHRETSLLAAARARGLHTLDGSGMLLHQGARAFRIWTGIEPPIEAMAAALRG